jgi:hypothetical protein
MKGQRDFQNERTPDMNHSRRSIFATAVILTLTALFSAVAWASDKYVKSPEPVFPSVQEGRALAYFVRPQFMRMIPNSTFKVFVDETPAGWLPQRCYLTLQVEPGSRVVWGPFRQRSLRFNFQAGRTYVFVLVEQYGQNRILMGTEWTMVDPENLRALVADTKVAYVQPTDEAMAGLLEEAAKKIDKVERKAPAAAAGVPASPSPVEGISPSPVEPVAIIFDQRKWHVGSTGESRGQRITEWVLPDETVDNWTELVTSQEFPGAQKQMTAEENMALFKKQLNLCPKAMWSVIQGGKDQVLFEWQTSGCRGWDDQYEVDKIITGTTATHRIAYTNRKLPISDEARHQWIDLIGKASVQAPESTAPPATSATVKLKNGKTYEVRTAKDGFPLNFESNQIKILDMGFAGRQSSDKIEFLWSLRAEVREKGDFVVTVTTPLDEKISTAFECKGGSEISQTFLGSVEYPSLWAWIEEPGPAWIPFVFSFEDKDSGKKFEVTQWAKFDPVEMREMMKKMEKLVRSGK